MYVFGSNIEGQLGTSGTAPVYTATGNSVSSVSLIGCTNYYTTYKSGSTFVIKGRGFEYDGMFSFLPSVAPPSNHISHTFYANGNSIVYVYTHQYIDNTYAYKFLVNGLYISNSYTDSFKLISVGDDNIMVMDNSNNIQILGSNEYGQFGNGTTSTFDTTTLQIINDISNLDISGIASGNHSIFRTSNGELYSCGNNSNGQTLLNTTDSVITQIQKVDILSFTGIDNILDIKYNIANSGSGGSSSFDTTAIDASINSLEGDVNTIQDDVTTIQGVVNTIQGDITNLYMTKASMTTLTNYALNDSVTAIETRLDNSMNSLQTTINDVSSTKLNINGGKMSGNIDMSNNRIVNVMDPSDNQDVSTKNYVDNEISKLSVNSNEFYNRIDSTTGNMIYIDNDKTVYVLESYYRSIPYKIKELINVKMVCCTYNSYYALIENETIMAWGDNASNQLGIGSSITSTTTPTPVKLNSSTVLSNVKYITASHTELRVGAIVLPGTYEDFHMYGGIGYVWGNNDDDGLCIGQNVDPIYPTRLRKYENYSYSNMNNVKKIIINGSHIMAISNNNVLYLGGKRTEFTSNSSNYNSYALMTTNIANVIDIYPGFIKYSDNSIKAYGANYLISNGQSSGSTMIEQRVTPIDEFNNNIDDIDTIYTGTKFTLFIKNNGDVLISGYNHTNGFGYDTSTSTLITKAIAHPNRLFYDCDEISVKGYCTYLLKNNKLYVCGMSRDGMLGNGIAVANYNIIYPTEMTSLNQIFDKWAMFNDEPNGNRLTFRYTENTYNSGYISNINANTQINFTGQHHNYSVSENIDETLKGFIVISTGTYKNQMNHCDSCNKYKITINESLPIVDLSTKKNDIRVFGVISNKDDNQTFNEQRYGNFVSIYEKNEYDRPLTINSLGEGAIWICDYNGRLVNGQYISTSPIPGIGMMQNDDLLHNYTVAKITMDCNFSNETEYKRKLKVEEVYILQKHYVYDYSLNIMKEEYMLDDSGNTIQIQDTYSNGELKYNPVVDEDGNYIYEYVLDDSGNYILVDKYESKYVEVFADKYVIYNEPEKQTIYYTYEFDFANGSQDQQDCIGKTYVMAFVGCTYHCG
jgi:alpha-tubulin suppressor-like RCC1 family protein